LRVEDVGREIRRAASQYATIADATSRMSLRARVLGLIDELDLAREEGVITRQVSAEALQGDSALRGSIVMHLDLVFRSSVSASEVLFTAAHGMLRIAEHPALDGFPIGVVLALPTRGMVRHRRELFDEKGPELSRADMLMIFALATSPPRLGAGVKLLEAVKEEAGGHDPPVRMMAFSPLTGLRARVIRLVDDDDAWRENLADHADLAGEGEILREQVLDLLPRETLPDFLPEPASSWLSAEARSFARSTEYGVGNFHRSMGATLVGVADGGDPKDSDAMWARAYFDYGAAE
jgi:hypothetical protein